MAPTETRLVLIRHGESVAQAQEFVSGHDTCTGLSATGRTQAAALRDRLLATGELCDVDAVYTSVLARAIETSAILAPALGEARPTRECDWCETHPGEAEGLSWEEAGKRYPLDSADPFHRRVPGAETPAELYVRAGSRLRRVAAEHPDEQVVVVCHGGVIGASFVALGEISITQGMRFTGEVRNTSLTEWHWTGSRWRLVCFNDAGHLASADASGTNAEPA